MALPESPPTPLRVERRPWWRRPFPQFALTLLLLVVAVAGYYFYRVRGADLALAEALAEADRLDPHWRLNDIEARRAVIPERENAAVQVVAVRKLMPDGWGAKTSAGMLFLDLPPAARLNPHQAKALHAELGKVRAALAEARKLKDLPRGRFPITYDRLFRSVHAESEAPKEVVNLLADDVLLWAEDQQPDKALDSCRAILNCGRAIGDEPLPASQLLRMACRASAVKHVIRTLAQGEPSPTALLAAQRLLEDEEGVSLLLIVARGLRAGNDRTMEAYVGGEIPREPAFHDDPFMMEQIECDYLGGMTRQRAALLSYLNRAVEIAKRPPREWVAAFRALEATGDYLPGAPCQLPRFVRFAQTEQRSLAQLRCGLAALAAERYRRERGDWPNDLAALAARGYLKGVPLNPFDGAPLRWRRLGDGVEFEAPGSVPWGTGLRLWDVSGRRQAPLPADPVPEAPPEDGEPALPPPGEDP
jgi:hypothetical protein